MPRKTQGPKYTPERAAAILADAEMIGEQSACKKWGVSRVTIYNYKKRLASDPELEQLLTLKRRMLSIGWQAQACKTLNVALNDLARRIPIAKTENDSKVITAIAGTCKIVGELKITSDVLAKRSGNPLELAELDKAGV